VAVGTIADFREVSRSKELRMATTDYGKARTSDRASERVATNGSYRERVLRETKPSFKTTEFWAMLAGIIVVAVVYNASQDPSLDLFRASLLATILAVAYIASRGLAKSGSRDARVVDDDRY
jgi:hypothetical protein